MPESNKNLTTGVYSNTAVALYVNFNTKEAYPIVQDL